MVGEAATPPTDPLVACDQPECTRTDHTIGYLREQLRKAEDALWYIDGFDIPGYHGHMRPEEVARLYFSPRKTPLDGDGAVGLGVTKQPGDPQ